jgi:hypothetical protein
VKISRIDRRMAAGSILAAWVVALGWLALRELSSSEDQLAEGARRIGPGASFYAVELDGAQLGTVGLTVDTSATGFQLLEVWSLDLPAGDSGRSRHSLRVESRLSRSFRLLEAESNLSEAGAAFRYLLRTGADTLVLLGGRPRARPSPLDRFAGTDVTIPPGVSLRLAASGLLRPGAVLVPVVVEPLGAAVLAVRTRVRAESTFVVPDSAERDAESGVWRPVHWDIVTAWRSERASGSGVVREWIDREGRPVQVDFPFGVTLRRSAFELVNRRGASHPTERGTLAGSRPAAGRDAPDPALVEVRVVVARRDGEVREGDAEMFAGGRQLVRGDTVVILRDGVAAESSGAMRFRNSAVPLAGGGEALNAALRLALERYAAVGDTLTRLVRWVARDVRLDSTAFGPVAPDDVMLVRRATPEGKARLLVALARQAGWAARVVSGVVVTQPDLPGHTWVEVWQGRWIAVDPLFGQVPASAALLRAVEGPGRPLVLVPRVGALRATVVWTSRGTRRS